MPTAIDASSVLGLVAVGVFTAQILIGLLLSVGYNPVRQWPRQRVKLFIFHNWLAYIGLTIACTHPLVLLLSSTAGFRLFDILVPIWSPTQPVPNTLGARCGSHPGLDLVGKEREPPFRNLGVGQRRACELVSNRRRDLISDLVHDTGDLRRDGPRDQLRLGVSRLRRRG